MSIPPATRPIRRTIFFIVAYAVCLGGALYAEYYTIAHAWIRASGFMASFEKQDLLDRTFHEWGLGFLVAIGLLTFVLARGTRGIRQPRRLLPLLAVSSAVVILSFGYLHSSYWSDNIDGHLAHFASSDHGWGESFEISQLKPGEQIVVESLHYACDGPGSGRQYEFTQPAGGVRFTSRDGTVVRNPKLCPSLQPILVFFPKVIRGEISDYMALNPGVEVGTLTLSADDLVGLGHTIAVLRRHENRIATGYTTYRFSYRRNGQSVGEECFLVPHSLDIVTQFAEDGLFGAPDLAPDEADLAHAVGVPLAAIRQMITLEMLDHRLRVPSKSSAPPAS